jgi:hypothetical protein
MDVQDWHDIEYFDNQPGNSYTFSIITGSLSAEQIREIAELSIPAMRRNFNDSNEVKVRQINRLTFTSEQIYVSPDAAASLNE